MSSYKEKLKSYLSTINIDSITSPPKLIANWIIVDLKEGLAETAQTFQTCKVAPVQLVKLIWAVEAGIISKRDGKQVLKEMLLTGKGAARVIVDKELLQESNQDTLKAYINKVIQKNQKQVEQLKEGNKKVVSYLVGQVMKESKGAANPKTARSLLEKMYLTKST